MKKQISEPYNESMREERIRQKIDSGITLIEVLISLLVLALALLPAIGAFSTYYGTATKQVEQETALKIGEAVVNQLQTLSFGCVVDGAIPFIPLNITTSEGSYVGKISFDGYKGSSEDIRINRISYKIEVEINKIFTKQDLSSPHGNAMSFNFLDLDSMGTLGADGMRSVACDSFDEAFIFNVTVFFGKTIPIRLTSFRTDMVK